MSAPWVVEATSALTAAWDDIRAEWRGRRRGAGPDLAHRELPAAVLVVASGTAATTRRRGAHWTPGCWTVDTAPAGEVMVAAEHLGAGPRAVLDALAHEAVHALCWAARAADTSRQGRYHNQSYRDQALALGLQCWRTPPHGWVGTSFPAGWCNDALARLWWVCRRGARSEAPVTRRSARDGRRLSLVCSCGRRIALSPAARGGGDVLCAACGAPFIGE